MINAIKIETSGNMCLVDLKEMKLNLPFARHFKYLNKYYFAWDEDYNNKSMPNKLATKLTGSNQINDIYIIKSHNDISGIFSVDECEPCGNYDLQLFIRLKENLYELDS